METLLRSLNYDLQFDKEAQHILENSRSHTNAIALTSTPTITTLDTIGSQNAASVTTSDFLQKLGATIINSIQLQASPIDLQPVASASESADSLNMDYSLTPHQVIIDAHTYDSAMGELQKQVEYDQFMNEVWIGIVLILILISMVFCFCSCFLYHQFRVWKRNYRTTIVQNNNDDDSVKITLDLEDPVPEYTLVSGLPSYEAALEILHKNPQSCLIVHPSVFEVFNKNEKSLAESTTPNTVHALEASESANSSEASTPLLSDTLPKAPQYVIATLPSYREANAAGASPLPYNHSFTSISLANEKAPVKSQSSEKCKKSNDKSQKF